MSLLVIDRSNFYFYKMDEAIRRAAAARKRGDFEQDTFWRNKVREYAEMHKKAALNASEGAEEKAEQKPKRKLNRTSREYKRNAIQNIRLRSHGNVTP